jgi:hypothetical protein
MPSKKSKPDWNELQYISWKEFRKMAPSVTKLEINRIDMLIREAVAGSDFYNLLIKARYELNQFVNCLEKRNSPPLPDSCINHLSNTILTLSPEEANKTVQYILDRLNYVYNRIGMIY